MLGLGFRIADIAVRSGLSPVLDLPLLSGVLSSAVTFTRASQATFFDVTGTLQTATTNVPRFDFDPNTHLLNGLLLEESRTNFLLNSGAPVTQTTASLGTGTYTLWVVGTGTATSSAGTATATGLGAATAGSPNVLVVTVAGTITVTITGGPPTRFQLENGANPTSYIPTTGTTATRAADVGTIPVTKFAWNPAAGSTAAEFIVGIAPANNQYIVSTSTQGSNPLFILPTSKVSVYDGAAGQATSGNSFTVGVVSKAASAWGASGAIALNNGTVATSTWNNSIMAATTAINFGTGAGLNPDTQIWLRRVRVWSQMLTNAQLQALTV